MAEVCWDKIILPVLSAPAEPGGTENLRTSMQPMETAIVSASNPTLQSLELMPTYRFQHTSCWETSMWGPTPCWPVDPDIAIIESLSRYHLQIPAEHHINVTFLAEGAFNKLYTIATSSGGDVESQLPYVFRVTLPVEPFYKTASEVATISYIREHTSVPVPRIVVHSPTAENELGFEWILMEKVPGVSLKTVWGEMDMETKERVTRVVAQFVKQFHDRCSFDVIGNLYFREALLDKTVRTIPTTDDKFVIGPTVTAFLFAGGRKLRLPRNLGPYSDDAEYMAALANAEAEDIKFLQSPEARTYADFDEDVANDTPEIEEALRELQEVWSTLFQLHPRPFALTHHDLSLSNILVDPATYKITGIVDWECTGTRPRWEDRYPVFLEGREVEEKPEPPSEADPDQEEFMTELWEDWEKTVLRRPWDEELGNVAREDDAADKMKLEWRRQLDWLEISPTRVYNWVREYKESQAL
jgi:aminoglycoside phosphotransferase (APT) family kinase protein